MSIYAFIKDEDSARRMGWKPDVVKSVLENLSNVKDNLGLRRDWEFHQKELRNNSFSYYDNTKVAHLAYVLWKEFDGVISLAIIEQETTGGAEADFLFFHRGRYQDWKNVIHPMYFDKGNGGTHHSVLGLGTKMFGAFQWQNRLLCNLMDKAMAPKILFRPTSAEGTRKFELTSFGDWGRVPAGFDSMQMPIQGFLTDGLAMLQATNQISSSTLAAYRGEVPIQESGNPPTKFQKQLEAAQIAALSETQFNLFYQQLDGLYNEVVRRLCDLNNPHPKSKAFKERCLREGVARECFGRIESVNAIRVIGHGSPAMRKATVDDLLQIISLLPEDGRTNLINDKIAVDAGQTAVERYNPPRQVLADEQQERAMNAVVSMKAGLPPVVSSSQNAVTFAATFLNAGVQALGSVQKGADPKEVLKFLSLCGPAIIAQLNRFARTRAEKQSTTP